MPRTPFASVFAVLAAALASICACADDAAAPRPPPACAPGNAIACPCAGGGAGSQTCSAAGVLGPCVCTARAPAQPGAPTPNQDKPDDVQMPEPSAADAAAVRERWLRGGLRGHDNNMARMRSVTITRAGGDRFAVRVANQFGFRCGLEFGPDGRPARMTRCRGQGGWTASPSVIELECETTERDEVCGGTYTLGSGGFRDRARFQLLRRLEPGER